MKYISTRNQLKKYSFKDIIIKSMPNDGGLFIPEHIPKLLINSRTTFSFSYFVEYLLSKYMTNFEFKYFNINYISKSVFKIDNFYNSKIFDIFKVPFFNNINSQHYFLNLNFGKTLSFKDISISFLSFFFNYYLIKNNLYSNVLVATSGDTGGSCLYYCKKFISLKVFVVSPYKCVSNVQEMQMFSINRFNLFNIRLIGNFDDCQNIIKSVLPNVYNLVTFNSVNFLRILIQSSYYVVSSYLLYKKHKKKVIYSIPTGNFGNCYSAFLAKKMGSKIKKVIICVNENDFLFYFFKLKCVNNTYLQNSVIKTNCPSMDISIPSNLERYVFYLKVKYFSIPLFISNSKEGFFYVFKCYKNLRNKVIFNIYRKYRFLFDTHTCNAYCSLLKFSNVFKNYIFVIVNTANHIKFYSYINNLVNKNFVYKYNNKLSFLRKKTYIFNKKDLCKLNNFIYLNKY
ncbi:MAG: pyridoxal-phosphate dependent enzyme [Candidatus Vidania fulgoroideorum]